LVHAERLRDLAARAQAYAGDGATERARDTWREAVELLPDGSQQRAVITEKLAALEKELERGAAPGIARREAAAAGKSWWGQGIAVSVALGVFLLTKGKFLLLGLTKLKTFVSMFAFFGVYWTAFGWPLALGFVVGIYIHEMGHVAMLQRLGIRASAPMFIPGVGAYILLKQQISDPRQDAAVGLAGPVWGLGAGLMAYAGYAVTDVPVWLAIAQITAWINLFNLLPFWQLDGSRAIHALSRLERWTIVAALGAAFLVTGVKLLVVIAGFAIWRTFDKEQGPGDGRSVAVFLVLIAALSWMSSLSAIPM
jgi:Zn-dependent protease